MPLEYLIIRFLARAGAPHADCGGGGSVVQRESFTAPDFLSISDEHSRQRRVCGVRHVGRSFAIPDALGWEGLPGTDRWTLARVTFIDASTGELRAAHDVLSESCAERLADALDQVPEERAVLGLFCELVLGAGIGARVGDIGCGTGRLDPFLAEWGLAPRGIDLSPEMIRVARRDQPGFDYEVADLRELPFHDASLAGIVCWYSLMYLAPSDRPAAFAELARGVNDAGFATVFWGGIPPEKEGASTQGYLIARIARC
jgi:SAM-dependent methyltransferase